jgi:hypothetical protein
MIRSTQAALVIALVVVAFPATAQEDPPAASPEPTAVPSEEAVPTTDVSSASKITTVYRNGYSITINGKKTQDIGTFTMAFKVSQEDPVTFTVNLTKGMKAKHIAQDLKKELSIAAGSRYKVKQNGIKVTVKKNGKKMPPLAVQIVEQKLTGVSLLISGL